MSTIDTPEVIATVQRLSADGNLYWEGQYITGISVSKNAGDGRDGILDIDIRDYKKPGENLLIQIPLPEFIQALIRATLNATDNS